MVQLFLILCKSTDANSLVSIPLHSASSALTHSSFNLAQVHFPWDGETFSFAKRRQSLPHLRSMSTLTLYLLTTDSTRVACLCYLPAPLESEFLKGRLCFPTMPPAIAICSSEASLASPSPKTWLGMFPMYGYGTLC